MMSVAASMMKLNRETGELRKNYSLLIQLLKMTETHAESLQEHVSTSVLSQPSLKATIGHTVQHQWPMRDLFYKALL